MRLSEFDFDLPEDRIALRPASPRDSARLLVVAGRGELADRRVSDLPDLLREGDALVFNDTRVIAARLKGLRRRDDGAVAVEATLHRRLSPSRWSAFAKPGRRLAPGDRIVFGEAGDRACLLSALEDLADQGTDILTLGQYLQPTRDHLPIVRYVHPDEFAEYKILGEALGFKHVEAGPLVRSSYHALEQTESANK